MMKMMVIIIIIIIIIIMKYKHKSDTSNNRGSLNYFKVIKKIPEQHTGKARHQRTTANSHIGHCKRTAGSTDVKYRTFNVGNSITYSMNCNYRIAAKLYTLER
jgi:hypothetical protein